jgi:hypothetical protein
MTRVMGKSRAFLELVQAQSRVDIYTKLKCESAAAPLVSNV